MTGENLADEPSRLRELLHIRIIGWAAASAAAAPSGISGGKDRHAPIEQLGKMIDKQDVIILAP